MRNIFAIACGYLLIGFFCHFLYADTSDIQGVSKKVQSLTEYAIPRTVAIKIHIGNKAGFGSGAIISADGYILTCAHVVEPAQALTVITSDKKEYQAYTLGINSVNDYAIIKINVDNLPYFTLGDSDKLHLLQWVVALGHPGGPYDDLQPAVAVGCVQGLGKRLPIQFGSKFYDQAIQTDVPIFAGNSGGPLIDLSGQLIGINGAIMLINNYAFSVPINEIKTDLKTMMAGYNVKGRSPNNIFEILFEMQEEIPQEDLFKLFEKGPLGKIIKLFGRDLSPQSSSGPSLGLTLKESLAGGLLVTDVERNKLGALAGIKVGDVLVNANDIPLRLREDLEDLLAKSDSKRRFFLTVQRDKTKLRLPVWFDRQAYSRDNIFKRNFVHQGLDLMPTTVRLIKNKQHIGYGAVISPDGWVLTNNTILGEDDDTVVVILQNEERSVYPAVIQGRNGVLDVALLKFNPVNSVSFIEMGDDTQLKLGQWVFSGGCLEGILQAGMVSATNREVASDRKIPTLGLFGIFGQPNKSPIRAYQNVIHHDTNIEDNQFGTPLVDANGKLVGINVAHFYRGTTFATPISAIKAVLEDMKAGKQVEVPEKYIPRTEAPTDPFSQILKEFFDSMDPKNDPLYELFRPKKGGYIGVEAGLHKNGVEILRLTAGDPAAKAGLKRGDIITAVGNQKIKTVVDLQKVIGNSKPGTNVVFTILRQNNGNQYEEQRITVCIGQRP